MRQFLQDDPSAVIRPLNGSPVLKVAMQHQCSIAMLRLLIEHGAPIEQIDDKGRSALEILVAMPVPDDLDDFLNERSGVHRPCPKVVRLHIQYVIVLMNSGAKKIHPWTEVGHGNEACAVCASHYGDWCASALLQQWMRSGDKDFLAVVSQFLHCSNSI